MPRELAIHWFPLLPGWVVALVAALLLAIVAWGGRVLLQKQVPSRWVIGLGLTRIVAVLLFAACLLQPVVSYWKRTPQPPELLVLVDTSQSMSRRDALDRTRLAGIVDDLKRSAMLDELAKRFDLKYFAFDRRARPIEASELNKLEPTSPATDFAASLASVGDLLDAESGSAAPAAPRRVLLVSDGQDRGAEAAADAAARTGTVVDVVVAGEARSAAGDGFEIVRVLAAPRVLLASETQFPVVVRRGSAPAGDYALTLLEDGREVQTQAVTLAADDAEQALRVAHRPTEVGLKRYEFVLTPKGTVAKPSVAAGPEAAPADRTRFAANVQVVDDKIEVLVLEDRWRWEFKFFRRVLEDDPSFNFTAMLARGGGAFLQLGEPERRVTLGGFPQSRAELDWFDLIVLGDVRPSRWPRGLAAAVADSVVEGGKSLVVVAGPTLGELAQVPELNELLPVDVAQDSATPIEGPLAVQLTTDGAASGIFSDGGSPSGPLPTIDRIYAPLRKRPGATVLVETAREANAAGSLILLAEQRVGRGRVLYVGTDALWKWQMLAPADDDGRTPYAKFWQQALRALTPRRTTAGALWLQAEQSRYRTGERVVVRAELASAEDERRRLEGAVVLPDGRRLPLVFEPDTSDDPLSSEFAAYRAEFDATLAGRYRVALAETVGGEATAEATTAIEVLPNRGEAEDAGADRAGLAALAARTGGKVVDPFNQQTWPQSPGGAPPEIDERRTVHLWDDFILVTLLCLVLGGDWLARMLRGYV